MTVRSIIILFLIGLIVMVFGTLFKINHWPFSGELILTSSFIKALAIILATWKLMTIDKFKEFLDS